MTRRLVEFLQQSDFAGVIFTKQGLPGTSILMTPKSTTPCAGRCHGIPLERFKISLALRMIDADWQRKAGRNSRYAQLDSTCNTLIAAGPDFRRGQTDDLPTGNVDVAPTILHILGIKLPQEMDGEFCPKQWLASIKPLEEKRKRTQSKRRKISAAGTWRQSMKISRVGSTTYLDEGNGAFAPNAGTKE